MIEKAWLNYLSTSSFQKRPESYVCTLSWHLIVRLHTFVRVTGNQEVFPSSLFVATLHGNQQNLPSLLFWQHYIVSRDIKKRLHTLQKEMKRHTERQKDRKLWEKEREHTVCSRVIDCFFFIKPLNFIEN